MFKLAENELKIPLEEKNIRGDVRQKIFKIIYKGYLKRFDLKLVCAYLSADKSSMFDYMLIFSGRNKANTGDLILYDITPKGTARSTVGYRYYKKMGKEEDFFQFGIENMCIISKEMFYEFIQEKLLLSFDKESEEYWKNKDNIDDVMIALGDVFMFYNRPKPM